jgi:FlaA1/EpsC-like NDP-sugar epimerase
MRRFLLRRRRAASELAYALLAVAALGAAFWARFDFSPGPRVAAALAWSAAAALCAKFLLFRVAALRDLSWRYTGIRDFSRLAVANAAGSAAAGALLWAGMRSALPGSIYFLDFVISMAFMTAARGAARVILNRRQIPSPGRRRVLIYGAGTAGRMLLEEIQCHPDLGFFVVGFLDDDPQKRNLVLNGARVFGGLPELAGAVRRHRIDEVLFALPAASGAQIASILDACRAAHVPARRIPRLAELIEHEVLVRQIRDLRVDDLLGRPPVKLDQTAIGAALRGRTVLVTGAAGSIGSELCRQIARHAPAAIVGLDQGETPLFEIDLEMRERFPHVRFEPEIGDVQNARRLREIFAAHRPEVVFHAAAYKHVPLMEVHPLEAIENNVFGTWNVARAASEWGASTFVLVSSDKAVRPVNIMGVTKRMAELVCLAAQSEGSLTTFKAVRFGNVLGSSGSVVPRFRAQISNGGPVTVTHPEMRRFFMTIPEAAQLVLQASAMGRGGEVFVLEMGEPVRIVDLARRMIVLCGLRPDDDIRIEYSGMRPGEKLVEELSAYQENTVATAHAQIRSLNSKPVSSHQVRSVLEELRRAVEARDAAAAIAALQRAVPEYRPSGFVLAHSPHSEPESAARAVATSA